MRKIELLSPAKDLATALAAIDSGADAVYIGAPAFGARKAAANSVEDIKVLTEYAHRFYCKVFVTLNTIIYDDELEEVQRLIGQLYDIGVDALIIQDTAILKMPIPPISLHASTQMHNYDMERIKFLDRLGFDRIVLARELSLEQIRAIRKEVKAELEVFIHGALCVSLSGQCYLSQHLFGRSANRGECAQPCRMKWSVRDHAGKVIVNDKYILSLKDLNLSRQIGALIEAGVDSFKIEGRLKDRVYVRNITHFYSEIMDHIIHDREGIKRSASGRAVVDFVPDPEKSFNRSYTDYFIHGRKKGLVNADTPKSVGKKIGTVKKSAGCSIWMDLNEEVHNGDGLCYFARGELKGVRVNTAEGEHLLCNEKVAITPGTVLYRNYDHTFTTALERSKSGRKIRVSITLEAEGCGLKLVATDEDGVKAEIKIEELFEQAENPSQKERIITQMAKCGESDFVCEDVIYEGDVVFIPSGRLNALRRELLEQLKMEREKHRCTVYSKGISTDVIYPLQADWKCNIVNKNASDFYTEHGAASVEEGFEKGGNCAGRTLMRTKYCLLFEWGKCLKQGRCNDLAFPLYLYNDKHCFELQFDCNACFMDIKL